MGVFISEFRELKRKYNKLIVFCIFIIFNNTDSFEYTEHCLQYFFFIFRTPATERKQSMVLILPYMEETSLQDEGQYDDEK
jgi:hypothetical protein